MRVPQMTRDNRSRPTSSVPSQCAGEGGTDSSAKSAAPAGSGSPTHAASNPAATTPRTQARASSSQAARAAAPGRSAGLAMAHPRVEQQVGHVDQQVDEAKGDGN